MNSSRYTLTQVLDLVERKTLTRLAERYNICTRHFGCRQQLICMGFAQLTWRESLRDIEECLNAKGLSALYHLGLREPLARVTLAEANEQRDWRLWQDLATGLIKRARRLYANEDLGLDLDETIYALDSTTIDLFLQLFRWAEFRSTKAGVKLHTQLGPAWSDSRADRSARGSFPRRAVAGHADFRTRRILSARPRLHISRDWRGSPAPERSSSREPKTTCVSRALVPTRKSSAAALAAIKSDNPP
jgi:hypothetical protein